MYFYSSCPLLILSFYCLWYEFLPITYSTRPSKWKYQITVDFWIIKVHTSNWKSFWVNEDLGINKSFWIVKVNMNEKIPSIYFNSHNMFRRQHCPLNICSYIGWIDKYSIQILRRQYCLMFRCSGRSCILKQYKIFQDQISLLPQKSKSEIRDKKTFVQIFQTDS